LRERAIQTVGRPVRSHLLMYRTRDTALFHAVVLCLRERDSRLLYGRRYDQPAMSCIQVSSLTRLSVARITSVNICQYRLELTRKGLMSN